ncbi:hypothetical protein KSP39_PZI007437 [Platanthera zijinensis]|uniref:Uncharacterized protein n=1 Tax=Platanthera zijinensis TaxID=2320716 RepID=A0AAP0G9X0_9ASPA
MGAVIQRILLKKYSWIDSGFYLHDYVPGIYYTCGPSTFGRSARGGSTRSSEPVTGIRNPPMSRAGSLRESVDDLRDSFEEHKRDVKKSFSGIQKFFKFLTKSLKLKPTSAEVAEWENPVAEPPR